MCTYRFCSLSDDPAVDAAVAVVRCTCRTCRSPHTRTGQRNTRQGMFAWRVTALFSLVPGCHRNGAALSWPTSRARCRAEASS